MNWQFLRLNMVGPVALVTLDRPPANAVSQHMYEEIGDLFGRFDEVLTSAKAVVLTGAGRHFCAGNDLDEFLTLDADNSPGRMHVVADAFASIYDCPVPVIGAVRGAALGTGLAIAPPGPLVPEPIMPLMYFTADPLPATELLAHGSVVQVVPDDELIDAAMSVARRITRHSRAALRHAKESLNAIEFTALGVGYEMEQRMTSRLVAHGDHGPRPRHRRRRRRPGTRGWRHRRRQGNPGRPRPGCRRGVDRHAIRGDHRVARTRELQAATRQCASSRSWRGTTCDECSGPGPGPCCSDARARGGICMTRSDARRPTGSRDAIFEVATRRFSEVGYGSTTIRDIADEVGILPGSLYAHITSKEALLHEIIDSGIERFIASAREAIESDEPAGERLRLAVRRHLAVVGESPARTMVVFHLWRQLTGDFRSRILGKRQQYEDIFTQLVEDGMKSGCFNAGISPRIAVLAILGALNWSAEWYSPSGPATPEQVGESMADYLILGLLSREAAADNGADARV